MFLILKKTDPGKFLLISTHPTEDEAREALSRIDDDAGDYIIQDSSGNEVAAREAQAEQD